MKNQDIATSQNDNQYLNYLTLTTMVTKAMQRAQRQQQIDFDLATDIARTVSQQIPSHILVKQAKTLTVDEILTHVSVQNAELSKEYNYSGETGGLGPEYEMVAIISALLGLMVLFGAFYLFL